MNWFQKIWREQVAYPTLLFRLGRKHCLGRQYTLAGAPAWFLEMAAGDTDGSADEDDLDRACTEVAKAAEALYLSRRYQSIEDRNDEPQQYDTWTVTLGELWDLVVTIRILCIKAAWRQVTGRWYYLRDEPDWFVETLAIQGRIAGAVYEPGDESDRLIREAVNEIARRDHWRNVDARG